MKTIVLQSESAWTIISRNRRNILTVFIADTKQQAFINLLFRTDVVEMLIDLIRFIVSGSKEPRPPRPERSSPETPRYVLFRYKKGKIWKFSFMKQILDEKNL